MLIDIPGLQPLKPAAGQEFKLIDTNQQMQVGQILKVVVVASVGENKLMLNLDGANINAKASQQFFPGEELKVKVEKQNGETVLKIQDRAFSTEILNQALRTVLPKQTSADQLINIIKQYNQLPEATRQNLPPSLQTALQQIANQLPTKSQLFSAAGLKQAIQNAGSFLENKLASPAILNNPNINQDFKGQLLKVLHTLQQISQQTSQLNLYNSTQNNATATNQNVAQTTNAQPQSQDAAAKEIAALLGKPAVETNTLSAKETVNLEQAARLKHAANLIRATNFSQPLLNTQPKTPAPQTPSQYNNLTSNAATSQQQGSQNTTTNQATAPHQSQTPNVFKHASLPIKGAVPQPIKQLQQQPVDFGQGRQVVEILKEEVTQSLARIQANQLSSIPKDAFAQPTFLIDLPVNIDETKTDLISLLIQEEESDSDNEYKTKNWSITLALDMENLGPLQVKVSLINEQVEVNIWADIEETKNLFEQKNYLLQEALNDEDINVKTLNYHQGLKENEIDKDTLKILDMKA